MDWVDNYTDASDESVHAEVIEDGSYIIVNLWPNEGNGLGIALNATQARQMANVLNALAAGL